MCSRRRASGTSGRARGGTCRRSSRRRGCADRALHHLVRADRELADAARALVGVEASSRSSSPSAAPTPRRRRRRRSAGARRDIPGRLQRRHVERISPSTPPSGGAAEDLAVGQVRLTRARLPRAALDVHAGGRCPPPRRAARARPRAVRSAARGARPARARRPPGRARRAAAPSRRTAPRRACPCARSALPAPSGYAAPTHRSSPAASRSSWRAIQGAGPRQRGVARARDAGALGRVAAAPHEEPAVEAARPLSSIGGVEEGDLLVAAVAQDVIRAPTPAPCPR